MPIRIALLRSMVIGKRRVSGAGLALTAVDVEAVLEIALSALGVGEVTQGGAAGGDGVVEHVADDGGEGFEARLRDLSGGDIDASKLPAGFGLKSLGAVGTNRNWNTVMKITAVLDEMEAAR